MDVRLCHVTKSYNFAPISSRNSWHKARASLVGKYNFIKVLNREKISNLFIADNKYTAITLMTPFWLNKLFVIMTMLIFKSFLWLTHFTPMSHFYTP